MEAGERMREQEPAAPQTAAGAGGGNLANVRRQADDLLAAGRDAIQQVLSHNSEDFLRANRQSGGE